MNILLLGDMSAYHLNLASGLKYLGYKVDVASSGDSFKNFQRDLQFGPQISRQERINFIKYKLNEYDIVQFIKDDVLDIYSMLLLFWYSKRLKIKSRMFLGAVGCDYLFWTKGRKKLNIPVFNEIEKFDETGMHNTWKHFIKNKLMLSCVEGVLGTFEYREAYKHHKKLVGPVFLPIDLEKLKFRSMDFSGKLIIYHGIQLGREGFKGSHHIKKAFDILNQKYPDDVECITKSNLPYDEYMETIDNCHVLFDQTNFVSYGMNALNGMALGKIVGSCSQDTYFWQQWKKLFSIDNKPPLIPILPDYQQIIYQIEWLIENRDKLSNMAFRGRAYVEEYHDCRKVAKLFLQRWGVKSG